MRIERSTGARPRATVAAVKPALIDLFCGIGGLGLGAARAGFDVTLSVDFDPIAIRTHERNFPNFHHLEADVASIHAPELFEAGKLRDSELAGLVGGPPCQGFSRIGKRCVNDERNSLFVHFFRLVAECNPAFYVAENVLGIRDARNEHIVKQALSRVPKKYKRIEPFVLKASDFGAATSRERVFFIGYDPDRVDALGRTDFDLHRSASTKVRTALAGLPSRLRADWNTDERGWRRVRVQPSSSFWDNIQSNIPNGAGDPTTVEMLRSTRRVSGCISTLHTDEVEQRFRALRPGSVDSVSRAPRLNGNELCPTLRAGTGTDRGSFQALRPIHVSEPRVISPREAARLQGFPDWFRLDPTKWHSFRGIGNSVSPFLSEAVFRTMLAKLPAERRRTSVSR
ncbi:MAG: (cytosine-5)-methyltransferase 1 [Verrucomicrobiota bacterium]|jgi:DNA (cytosine-5)-methyltransferase 1